MGFSTRRGRPKSNTPKTDLGTPELILKRAHGVTAEAIDRCLERGLITSRQHWCGMHLRWLYTLRYGAPNVAALDLTRDYGEQPVLQDPEWRRERENEYLEATSLLKRERLYEAVMQLAIYNEMPRFLDIRLHEQAFTQPTLAAVLLRELKDVQHGLAWLEKQWKKPANAERRVANC